MRNTFLSNVYYEIKRKIGIWQHKRALRKAIKLAEDKKLLTNHKQAVMLDYTGDYAVFSRKEFYLMRRRGRFDKKYKWENVLEDANYVTK